MWAACVPLAPFVFPRTAILQHKTVPLMFSRAVVSADNGHEHGYAAAAPIVLDNYGEPAA